MGAKGSGSSTPVAYERYGFGSADVREMFLPRSWGAPATIVSEGLDLARSWELNQCGSYRWSLDVVVTRDYETDTIVATSVSGATELEPSSRIRELDLDGRADVAAPTEVGRKLDFNDGGA